MTVALVKRNLEVAGVAWLRLFTIIGIRVTQIAIAREHESVLT